MESTRFSVPSPIIHAPSMNLVQASLLNNGKMLELWTFRWSSKQLTPLIRHLNLFVPHLLAFSLSALEFSLSMTFDLVWEQTLYFLAFLIWKPDDLFTGPREEGKQLFINKIALGFSFPSFHTHNSIITCCACALEMVWAAYKACFQCITASEDHLPLTISCLHLWAPSHCPPKAKLSSMFY